MYYNNMDTIETAIYPCQRREVAEQPGLVMPSQKNKGNNSRSRAPVGKRQVLIIMDQDVIKSVKVAAVEDDIKMSHAG